MLNVIKSKMLTTTLMTFALLAGTFSINPISANAETFNTGKACHDISEDEARALKAKYSVVICEGAKGPRKISGGRHAWTPNGEVSGSKNKRLRKRDLKELAASALASGSTSDGDYDDEKGAGSSGRRRSRGEVDGGSRARGSGRGSYYDPVATAQSTFGDIQDFCANVDRYIEEEEDLLNDNKAAYSAAFKELEALKTKRDEARKAMNAECKADCIDIAMDGKIKECAMSGDWTKSSSIIRKLNLDDLKRYPRLVADLKISYDKTQNEHGGSLRFLEDADKEGRKQNEDAVCIAVLGKEGCLEKIIESSKNGEGMGCSEFGDYKKAHQAVLDKEGDVVRLADLVDGNKGSRRARSKSCKVTAASVHMLFDADYDCLVDAKDDCDNGAVEAARQAAILASTQGYCPTCGVNGGPGMGGCVGGMGNCTGVSKAAQIIGAIGGIAVPTALGIMNMSTQNRMINAQMQMANYNTTACINSYNSYLTTMNNVGVPAMPPQCGAGYGMGGFMAGGQFGGGQFGMPGQFPGGIMPGQFPGGIPGQFPGGVVPAPGQQFPPGMYPPGMNPLMGPQMAGMNQAPGNMMTVQQQMYEAQIRMQQMQAQNMVLQQSMQGGMQGQFGMGYPYFGMGQNPMYGMYGGMNTGIYGGIGGGIYGGIGAGGMGGMPSPYGYSPYGSGGLYAGVSGSYGSPYSYNPYNPYGGGGMSFSAGINLGAGGGNPYGQYNPYANLYGQNPYGNMYGGGAGCGPFAYYGTPCI